MDETGSEGGVGWRNKDRCGAGRRTPAPDSGPTSRIDGVEAPKFRVSQLSSPPAAPPLPVSSFPESVSGAVGAPKRYQGRTREDLHPPPGTRNVVFERPSDLLNSGSGAREVVTLLATSTTNDSCLDFKKENSRGCDKWGSPGRLLRRPRFFPSSPAVPSGDGRRGILWPGQRDVSRASAGRRACSLTVGAENRYCRDTG